ncbi:coatomer alpha subunit, putative [Perkinsus marinus ATCC 50983]|uniref:Coatomer alpha subunit, putative n=1 Tax=Perkinsus marinus (strain ATCC 50983 / TXsc) TaxID=423536 RepID=C5KZ98_PERM5|nr:coatomer alpha subunit, putative [Perkinsus marinus ATCC 50983]EER10195.1 coatomer alpha subunit, putative [Perkinsus marinus ATCC 50983]|eukprot:XP_002778400.1 coatomer alpha subunit, putative [Perkinsus marinus ATCC 50983]
MTRDKEASSLLQPPVPLTRAATTNWPLLMSMEQIFDNKWAGVEEAAAVAVDEEAQQTTFLPGFDDDEEEGGTAPNAGGGFDAWGDDALASTEEEVDIGNAWGSDEDLGLGDLDLPAGPEVQAVDDSVVTPGEGYSRRWLRNRKMVPDLIAAGDFDEALATLQRRIGLINAIPLKPLFEEVYSATRCR